MIALGVTELAATGGIPLTAMPASATSAVRRLNDLTLWNHLSPLREDVPGLKGPAITSRRDSPSHWSAPLGGKGYRDAGTNLASGQPSGPNIEVVCSSGQGLLSLFTGCLSGSNSVGGMHALAQEAPSMLPMA